MIVLFTGIEFYLVEYRLSFNRIICVSLWLYIFELYTFVQIDQKL